MRRTQAERSASTQAALLDATVWCLVEHGVQGTSSAVICRQAGVSRGAQLHHFPTKASLMMAAVEVLCDRRLAEFHALVGASTGSARIDAAFEQLWQVCVGTTLAAWVELAVASRTDPELQAHMSAVSERLEDDAEQTLRDLFGLGPGVPLRASVRLALSLVDGLALRTVLQGEDASREALGVFRVLVEPWLRGSRP